MWAKFGPLAICTTYRRLKAALDSLDQADEPHLGLVRYGARHLTGWNTMRFITTKRDCFRRSAKSARCFGSRTNTLASTVTLTRTTFRTIDHSRLRRQSVSRTSTAVSSICARW